MSDILNVDDIRVSIIDDNDYKNIPILTCEEEKELFGLLKSSDLIISKKARDKIFYSNVRLVRQVASNYISSSRIDYEDLYMEGCIGLNKAIYSFDVSLGYKFSTYAINWIKKEIRICIMNQSNNIRIPIYFYGIIKKYTDAKKKYNNGFFNSSFYDYLIDNRILSKENIILVEKILNDTVSLDVPPSNDSETPLLDIIVDDDCFEDSIDNSFLPDIVKSIFMDIDMSPRDKEIICYRFGLYDYPIKTSFEVADLYNISHQRVRQITFKFIDKVKNSKLYRKKLNGYYIK